MIQTTSASPPEENELAAYLLAGDGDAEIVRDSMRILFGTDAVPNAVSSAFEAMARMIVDEHWRAIERVAAALIERATLPYAVAVEVAGDLHAGDQR
jgi:hypothetical protein